MFVCLFTKCKQTRESQNQSIHANLRYQPEVSTKFQFNQTAHGWEILFFVGDRQTTTTDRQTDMNPLRQIKLKSAATKVAADKNQMPCSHPPADRPAIRPVRGWQLIGQSKGGAGRGSNSYSFRVNSWSRGQCWKIILLINSHRKHQIRPSGDQPQGGR
jgi:hypothetical protein